MANLKEFQKNALERGLITTEQEDILNFVKVIQEERRRQNLTTRQLADKLDMNHSQISRLENLDNIPNLTTVFKVMNGLGLSLQVVRKNENKQVSEN
ncbi:hypothetical protein BAU15_02990 [Enterococcus sp. JM4C]|uniref:helix-turn-helix domain-containing protein n=1 Tax=Candidatus Enterococcus huntleyi TaxID=1857217 RepID=UPI00137AF05C|nr:helix-turn-helix transcriptional regulator [Enterococcus sp. JM4C]KAF1299624.1 hypothetical protein BAU15_02990 [Enterococcus sp. JM4C]